MILVILLLFCNSSVIVFLILQQPFSLKTCTFFITPSIPNFSLWSQNILVQIYLYLPLLEHSVIMFTCQYGIFLYILCYYVSQKCTQNLSRNRLQHSLPPPLLFETFRERHHLYDNYLACFLGNKLSRIAELPKVQRKTLHPLHSQLQEGLQIRF